MSFAPCWSRSSHAGHVVATPSGVNVTQNPQFSDRLVRTVIKGTSAKTALIDPLGSGIDDGPELYITLLKNMADSFKSCFNT